MPTLTHPFIYRCLDRKTLLENCQKLNTYLSRLEKQSLDSPDPDKYKGDGLELFTETLIKLSPIDARIGIKDYVPIFENDTGVDGHGVGLNGSPATVQVKFRQADHVLTANGDHLSNFVMTSNNKFGVKIDDKNNMLIVTTAKGIHHFTDIEMFQQKVRVLNRENLRKLVDNNPFFWDTFESAWEQSLIPVNNAVANEI